MASKDGHDQEILRSAKVYTEMYHPCPGKTLVIADTLSQAYLCEKFNNCVAEEFEINALLTLPVLDIKLAQLKENNISAGSELQQLMNLTADGWLNNKSKVPAPCLPYWTSRDRITYCDGVLFKGEQIIIPKT